MLSLLVIGGCSVNRRHYQPDQQPAVQNRNYFYGQLDGWQPVSHVARPFNSLSQHSFSQEGGDFDPDISADGQWMVFTSLRHSPNPDLYIKQISGSTATRLTSDPASEIQPSFSPSGDKVAYASNRSGSWDIWVVGVDGTNPTRITSSSSSDIHPSWSPDGKQIVYCSYGARSQQWELWVVNVSQPSIQKWLGYGLFPQWSPNPDVPKIAFQVARHRGSKWFSIWTVEFVDGEAKFPTEIVSSVDYACVCPAWSADASQLSYSTVGRTSYDQPDDTISQGTGENIWIIDLDGRNNLQLTHSAHASNYAPTWSSDGRVFFCSDRKGMDNVWSIKPQQVNFTAERAVKVSQQSARAVRAN